MKHFLGFAIFIFGFSLFSQTSSTAANKLILEAAGKASVNETISFLSKNISSLETDSDKKAAFSFLGALQEQAGKFEAAKKSYTSAAALAGSTNSEKLVISAVRCALNSGDAESALSFLKSSVRDSNDAYIQAQIKLYEQWAFLCKANSAKETEKPVAALKSFLSDKSMTSVMPSILLTLWHITGEDSYSSKLKTDFPSSPETKIIKGEINALPTPFWLFMPRKETAFPEIAQMPLKKSATSSEKEPSSSAEKIVREQLGLFRDVSNANALAEKVKSKGFDAKIMLEKRPSGNVYYIVVVDENKDMSIGKELRTAGFECYPVFE